MSEKHAALLTASVILSGLGLFLITIPAGLLFGAALIAAGLVLAALTSRRAVPEWRAARAERRSRSREGRDSRENSWTIEEILGRIAAASGGLTIGAVGLSLWRGDPQWTTLALNGALLLISGGSLIALLWRRRRPADNKSE